MKDTHALDALLHATAPIPLPEVRKLIIEALNRERKEFLDDLKIFQNECVDADWNNFDPMQYIEEVIEKWEKRIKE